MRVFRSVLLATSVALIACAASSPPPVAPPPPQPVAPPAPPPPVPVAMNPFSVPSSLQYQAPPFDRSTTPTTSRPSTKACARSSPRSARSRTSPTAPTFDNTIVAHRAERGAAHRASPGVLRDDAARTPTTRSQKVEERLAPKLAAHQDAIYLDREALRAREGGLRRTAPRSTPSRSSSPSATTATSCTRARSSSRPTRRPLRALNKEESSLSDGLRQEAPRGDQGRGARRDQTSRPGGPRAPARWRPRRKRRRLAKLEGKWVVPLQNTTQQPAQVTLAEPRDARAALQGVDRAGRARGRERHAGDRAAARRASRRTRRSSSAIPTYAAYVLEDQMAETPGEGGQATDGHGPRGCREGARRGGEDAGARRQAGEAAGKRFSLAPVGLAVLRRAGPKGGLCARRRASASRTSSSIASSRTASSSPPTSFTASPSRSATTSPSTARRAGLRGVRRRRQIVRALLCGLLQARQQERRRVDDELRRSVGAARNAPGRLQRLQLHEARAGAARAPHASTTSRRCSTSSVTRFTGCSRT